MSTIVLPYCLKFASLYRNWAFKNRFLYCLASTFFGLRKLTSISLIYCSSFSSASLGSYFSSSVYINYFTLSFITTYLDRWIWSVCILLWWSISSSWSWLMLLSTTFDLPPVWFVNLLSLSALWTSFLTWASMEKFLLKAIPSYFLTEKNWRRWSDSLL